MATCRDNEPHRPRRPGCRLDLTELGCCRHQSTTDPEARLLRKGKGKEAKLVFMAHRLRSGKPPRSPAGGLPDYPGDGDSGAGSSTGAGGPTPRSGAFIPKRWAETKATTPGIAWRPWAAARGDASRSTEHQWPAPAPVMARTTRHPGYAISQRIRKRVEEIFGCTPVQRWATGSGGRGISPGWTGPVLAGYLVATAYNLVRMAKLLELAKEAVAGSPGGMTRQWGYPCPVPQEGRVRERPKGQKSRSPRPNSRPNSDQGFTDLNPRFCT